MDIFSEIKIKNLQKIKKKIKKYHFIDVFGSNGEKKKKNFIKKEKENYLSSWNFFFSFFFFSDILFKRKKFNGNNIFNFITFNKNNEKGNPLGHFEHFFFLFINMANNETKYLPKATYMKYQSDINGKMRTILIDWLVDVHLKFKLAPKTLFLSINILDRFLSNKKIIRQKLQLLGITTLLIASKYEEIYAPETRDFVYISDNVYSQEDIFKMEALICTVLKFEFSYPSILNFLSHFLKILNPEKEIIFFSNYFIELTLFEISILKFPFSLVAVSTLLCVKKILKYLPKKLNFLWTIILNPNSIEKKNSQEECLNLIKSLIILAQNEKQKIGSIKRKYSTKKFGEISHSIFAIKF